MAKEKRTESAAAQIMAAALDPWRLRSESVPVPEWGAGVTVTLRAMTTGDWLAYNAFAATLAPPTVEETEPVTEPERSYLALYSLVLIRTLHDEKRNRVFPPAETAEAERAQAGELAKAFSAVHDRLVSKVFDLSGIDKGAADPVEEVGNG